MQITPLQNSRIVYLRSMGYGIRNMVGSDVYMYRKGKVVRVSYDGNVWL